MQQQSWRGFRLFLIEGLGNLLPILLMFVILVGSLTPLWKDLLIASNKVLDPYDSEAHRTVFIQIDESFLRPDVSLAMQFDQWRELIEKVAKAQPEAILVDYHFSPRRFETLLPGKAEEFAKSLLDISNHHLLVMGLAPLADEKSTNKFTLREIEENPNIKKGCMELGLDSDLVFREFFNKSLNHCAPGIDTTMAGVVSSHLGALVKDSGLILTRASNTITQIVANDILLNQFRSTEISGAIVVIGSNFPNEDEIMSSHSAKNVFFHENAKGALIHGLNTEAILEGRVAWNQGIWLPYICATLLLIIYFLIKKLAIAPHLFWLAFPSLLVIDFITVNFYRIHINAAMTAMMCLSCALILSARKIATDLYQKQQIQGLLSGLLSPAVMDQCLKNPTEFFQTKVSSNASVLVIDLMNYSLDAATLKVNELYEQTNFFLSTCTNIIHRHGGCVERFRGDGLLAYFGIPLEVSNPTDAALLSCGDILDLIEESQNPTLKGFKHRIRFGISTGEVILGRVGDRRRFDIAVTGLAANKASHFESLSDPVRFPVVIDQPSLANATIHWIGSVISKHHSKYPDLKLYGVKSIRGQRDRAE